MSLRNDWDEQSKEFDPSLSLLILQEGEKFRGEKFWGEKRI